MKVFFALLLLMAALLARVQAELPGVGRETLNFNREWKFAIGDHPGAEAVAFDDSKWEAIGLPHSFSIPYFAAGNAFYVGYGWYRKLFEIPARWTGQRLFLDFEGAFQEAEIFVNGRKVGEHRGGYTGFEIDITEAAKPGTNLVAVRLNNLWNPRLAPRAGEHVFSGGLYRNVWLVAANPLHVAWYGTFVTTPQVSREAGTVNVKTEVVNQSSAVKPCGLRSEVIDPEGRVVAEMNSTQTIAPRQMVTFEQTSPRVASPRLWSPEHPTLYRIVTTVLEGSRPVDRFETPFGFRNIRWTADQGFFINGEHRYFKGANVHQDHAGWGDAVTNAGAVRDVKMVKDAGFDFIRGSHYPHAPAFSSACDEIGLLFWSENCFWGTGGFKGEGYWNCSAYPIKAEDQAAFEESVKASLRDMIRIHRNHPSIVVWSMGNETFFSVPEVMPKVREFLKELVALSHQLDPTRPAAIGGAQRGGIDKIGDVAGQNGDGGRLPQYLNTGVPSVVSEYGSVSADRPGNYDSNNLFELANVPGADKNERFSWRFPWRSGEVIWCAFDHGSIAGRKFGAMGLVDYFRLPKRSWYWYRNEYAHVPPPEWPRPGTPAALTLKADRTTLRQADGTEDAHLVVTVVDASGKPLSNSLPVTLTVESGPGEFPTGPSITFAPDSDIDIRDGQAAIEFRSYYSGTTVIRATSPGLVGAALTLTTQGGPEYVAGKTPVVKVRPYRPVTERSGTGTSIAFGTDNPTRASSEAPGHNGGLANDGNPGTFWQAANTMANAWWQVDLERIVAIEKIKLAFPEEGAWRYRIEVSFDGVQWKLAADQSSSSSNSRERTDAVAAGSVGRFVRVTFVGLPPGKAAALAEVNLLGRLKTE